MLKNIIKTSSVLNKTVWEMKIILILLGSLKINKQNQSI